MNKIKTILAIVVVLVFATSAAMAAETANSAKYASALSVWAEKKKEARETARDTYLAVQLDDVSTGLVKGAMYDEGKIRNYRVILRSKLVNKSEYPVKFSKIIAKIVDKRGKTVASTVFRSENKEYFPGSEDFSFAWNIKDGWDGSNLEKIENGETVIQIKFYELMVLHGGNWERLEKNGTAFAPNKPRAPYNMSEEAVRMAVGKAETEAGVYDYPEDFPERPWYPLYGASGAFSGKAPTSTAKASVSTPEYGVSNDSETYGGAAAKPIEEVSDSEDDSSYVESAVDGMKTVGSGAKSAADTVGVVKDLANTLGGLFN